MKNIDEIIMKLVGSIDPVGETHTDTKVKQNLVILIDALYPVIYNIEQVARINEKRHEASRQEIGKLARSFLNNLAKEIGE